MKKRRKANSYGKMWLLTALLITIVVAALIYLQKHTPLEHVSHKKSKKTVTTTATKPHFDFYTVLPQNKNESVPSKNLRASIPSPKTPKATNVPAITTKYILQIAAVKNYADADQLKAQLTLLGYTVNIQKITLHNITWNRVNLGPYSSLNEATTAQADLQKNKIKSILLKTK